MVNIKGLNKAKVLAALYNASKPLGLGMKVDLSSDEEFDDWLYDRDNGVGAAQKAVNSIS